MQSCGSQGWARVGSGTVRPVKSRESRPRSGAEGTSVSCRSTGELVSRGSPLGCSLKALLVRESSYFPSSSGGRPFSRTHPRPCSSLSLPHSACPSPVNSKGLGHVGLFFHQNPILWSLSQDTSLPKGTGRVYSGTFCCRSGEISYGV